MALQKAPSLVIDTEALQEEVDALIEAHRDVEFLYIANNNNIRSVSLSNMYNMRGVMLAGNPVLESVSLSNLPRVEIVDCHGSAVSNLTFFACSNIKILNIERTNVAAISLAHFHSLKRLIALATPLARIVIDADQPLASIIIEILEEDVQRNNPSLVVFASKADFYLDKLFLISKQKKESSLHTLISSSGYYLRAAKAIRCKYRNLIRGTACRKDAKTYSLVLFDNRKAVLVPFEELLYKQTACMICMNDYDSGQVVAELNPCKHNLCANCVDKVKVTCPICSRELSSDITECLRYYEDNISTYEMRLPMV